MNKHSFWIFVLNKTFVGQLTTGWSSLPVLTLGCGSSSLKELVPRQTEDASRKFPTISRQQLRPTRTVVRRNTVVTLGMGSLQMINDGL